MDQEWYELDHLLFPKVVTAAIAAAITAAASIAATIATEVVMIEKDRLHLSTTTATTMMVTTL